MRRVVWGFCFGMMLTACNPWRGLYAPIPAYELEGTAFDGGGPRDAERDIGSEAMIDADMKMALGVPVLQVEEFIDSVHLSWSVVEGATGYEVVWDDGAWINVGDVLEYSDGEASAGTLHGEPVLVASDATSDIIVALSINGAVEAVRGTSRSYSVRAVRGQEKGPSSSPLIGARVVGDLSIEYSVDDGSGGSVIVPSDGAQAMDLNAPVNGERVSYSAVIGADGVDQTIVLEDTGRLLAVVDITAGGQASCAVLSNGKVKCWGANFLGVLGHGTTMPTFGGSPGQMPPPDSIGIEEAVKVSVSLVNVAVIEEGGGVRVWGGNEFGQVYGSGEPVVGDQPGEVPATMPFAYSSEFMSGSVRDVQFGYSHGCALDWDGRVFCWGGNDGGQLGRGDTQSVTAFNNADLYGYVPFSQGYALELSMGFTISCALSSEQEVYCWGAGREGRCLRKGDCQTIGDELADLPLKVSGFDTGVALSIDVFSVICVQRSLSRVACWGDGEFGALGRGNEDTVGESFGDALQDVDMLSVSVSPIEDVEVTNSGAVCVLLSDGDVRCWGSGYSGALGQGDLENLGDELGDMVPSLPLRLGGKAVKISAGTDHFCALLDSGRAKCWGGNGSGQLGIETLENMGDDPGEMPPPDVKLW